MTIRSNWNIMPQAARGIQPQGLNGLVHCQRKEIFLSLRGVQA